MHPSWCYNSRNRLIYIQNCKSIWLRFLYRSSHFSFEELGNIAEKLRKVYAGLRPDSKLGKVFEDMKDKFEKLQNMFADAIVTASYGIKSAASASNQEGRTLNAQGRAENRPNIDRERAENAKLLKEQVKLAESRTIAEYEERSRELVAKYGDRLKERYSLAEQKAKIKKDIKELDKLFKADRGIWQKSH